MKKELKIFDNPANVKRLVYGFFAVLVLLIVLDFLLVDHEGHGAHAGFAWEHYPAFFAVYGFVSYVVLIFVAKGLRLFVMRKENYYE
ncbi:MAG: hypothetical protein KJ645_14110 [Planctomycetes bacterium]|nr:hypothetical protein [Planctomycetota bacterium]